METSDYRRFGINDDLEILNSPININWVNKNTSAITKNRFFKVLLPKDIGLNEKTISNLKNSNLSNFFFNLRNTPLIGIYRGWMLGEDSRNKTENFILDYAKENNLLIRTPNLIGYDSNKIKPVMLNEIIGNFKILFNLELLSEREARGEVGDFISYSEETLTVGELSDEILLERYNNIIKDPCYFRITKRKKFRNLEYYFDLRKAGIKETPQEFLDFKKQKRKLYSEVNRLEREFFN